MIDRMVHHAFQSSQIDKMSRKLLSTLFHVVSVYFYLFLSCRTIMIDLKIVDASIDQIGLCAIDVVDISSID